MKKAIYSGLIVGTVTFGLVSSYAIATTHAAQETAVEKTVVGSIPTSGISKSDYTKFAKISIEQAAASAKAQVRGQISSVELENEDGFLVYSVELFTADSKLHEILIDAGSGALLSNEVKAKQNSDKDNDEDEDD